MKEELMMLTGSVSPVPSRNKGQLQTDESLLQSHKYTLPSNVHTVAKYVRHGNKMNLWLHGRLATLEKSIVFGGRL